MKRYLTITLMVLLFALLCPFGAGAVLSRAAMVTETSGDSKLGSKPVRTLQVFSEGSEVNVGKGAKLRLVYLQSGQKESVNGPCQVLIGASASKWLSGEGKVVGEQASGAKTKLRRSENIRRMGGSLQANVEQGPAEIIAMIEPPKEANLPRSVKIDPSQIWLVGVPGVSLSADVFKEFHWRGGKGPYSVTFRGNDGPVTEVVDGPSFVPTTPRYVPGKTYELKIIDQSSSAKLTFPFKVLLPSEKANLDANVEEFAAFLGGTPRDQFMARITVAEEWGLDLEALAAARAAVKEFPEEVGFQLALGRILHNVGELDDALEVLNQAAALESGSN